MRSWPRRAAATKPIRPSAGIVDPLDGTTNFAHGYPCFAVSIGLEEAGELIAGVDLPAHHAGSFSRPRKGEGAYLNQKRIHVSDIERLATSLLATGFPSVKRSQNPNIHYYWDFTMRSHGVRRDGSAALDLAAVACGRFDGFWEFGLHSWDTAAGVLLVREAGGTVTTFSGQPYRPGDHETLASNGHVHEEMRQVALDVRERAAQRPVDADVGPKSMVTRGITLVHPGLIRHVDSEVTASVTLANCPASIGAMIRRF